VNSIGLDQVTGKCQAVSENVIYRLIPKTEGNFFTSWNLRASTVGTCSRLLLCARFTCRYTWTFLRIL